MKQHLAFHIHVPVVTFCHLVIALFNGVISSVLVGTVDSVVAVLSVSVSISVSVTLRVVAASASDSIVSVPS